MMGWEYVDHTYTNLCIHMCVYIYTHAVCKYIYVCIPNPQLSHILPMFASISHDTHGWGMVQNLQSLPRTHKYPLIFPFYVHIHTCMHTYKNGYSPQMLFHLPECACLLAGPGHGQLQRDGFLTLLFKVYAIQRWVKATKNGSFATTC